MVTAKDRDWRNRGHFFAIAARVMRRYLIDHARRQPDVDVVSFGGMENLLRSNQTSLETALEIDHALEKLASVNPEWCNVVELKYFLGLTDEEVAETLGIGLRSAQRAWYDARSWLFDQMHGNE
jgi:RNA polymerase sigma factor (TIGR02999 family)